MKKVTKKRLEKYGWGYCLMGTNSMDHPAHEKNGIFYDFQNRCVSGNTLIGYVYCDTMKELKTYVLRETLFEMVKIK